MRAIAATRWERLCARIAAVTRRDVALALCWLVPALLIGSLYWLEFSAAFVLGTHAAFIVVCVSEAAFFLRRDRVNVFSALPWHLLACAIYFGIGPLVYVFRPDGPGILHLDTVYPITFDDLTWILAQNALGCFCVFSGYCLTGHWTGPANKITSVAQSRLQNAFVLFVFVGGIGTAAQWSMEQREQTPPALVGFVANLLFAATLIGGIMSARYPRGKVYAYVLLSLQLTFALATLSKLTFAFTLLSFGLGYYFATLSVSRFAAIPLILAMAYPVAMPIVLQARYLTDAGDGIFDRLDNLAEAGSSYGQDDVYSTGDGWTRLCYSPFHMFAGEQIRVPIDSLQEPWVTFCPRFLWPDKPTFAPGSDFCLAIRGQRYTNFSISLFGEAFMHHGWPGIVGWGLLTGAIFRLMFAWTASLLAANCWLAAGVGVQWILHGMRVDGWAQIDIVTPFYYSCLVLAALALLYRRRPLAGH